MMPEGRNRTIALPGWLLGRRKLGSRRERGAALIIALLLVTLMGGLSLAMFVSVSSDSLINGYYRNFRGSFYAADSGLNITRQSMVSLISAAAPATFALGTPPLPAGLASTVQSSVLSSYGTSSTLNTGTAAGSWAESFYIKSATLTLAPNSPTITATDPVTGKASAYQYLYNYTIQAIGRSQGSEQVQLQEQGSITFNAALQPAGPSKTSFAYWGAFIDQYAACSGFLVPGLFSGPSFTNGTWNFGPPAYGQYIFTDPIGMASANASFWFNSGSGWSCQQVPSGNDTYQGQTIAPQYQAGYQWSQPKVPLPTNSYGQERAVLDGVGTNTTAVTSTDLNAHVRNINGTPYPLAGASSGVFLPYSVNSSTGTKTFNGGGIYVEGNAAVSLAATNDSSGNNTETYTITQGSVTTTIVVNVTTNTTTVSSGGTTQVISGVPDQYDPSTGALMGPATMLYVNGSITGLTGPYDSHGNTLPAIQDGTALTITAPGNITFTGDVVYKTEPVTTTQITGTNGTPVDTLIPGNNKGQVLGVFTVSGNLNLNISNDPNKSGNIQVDGSLAAISQGGSGGFFNTGPPINTFNNVGGQIQNAIYSAAINTENTYFDRRFSTGFGPPWFPSTTVTPAGPSVASYTSSVQRVQWVDLSHM